MRLISRNRANRYQLIMAHKRVMSTLKSASNVPYDPKLTYHCEYIACNLICNQILYIEKIDCFYNILCNHKQVKGIKNKPKSLVSSIEHQTHSEHLLYSVKHGSYQCLHGVFVIGVHLLVVTVGYNHPTGHGSVSQHGCHSCNRR